MCLAGSITGEMGRPAEGYLNPWFPLLLLLALLLLLKQVLEITAPTQTHTPFQVSTVERESPFYFFPMLAVGTKKVIYRDFPGGLWLKLCITNAEGPCSTLGQGSNGGAKK